MRRIVWIIAIVAALALQACMKRTEPMREYRTDGLETLSYKNAQGKDQLEMLKREWEIIMMKYSDNDESAERAMLSELALLMNNHNRRGLEGLVTISKLDISSGQWVPLRPFVLKYGDDSRL